MHINRVVDAHVSSQRIEAFLALPEVSTVRDENVDEITFRAATLAWACDTNMEPLDSGAFMLRSVDLVFPKGKLSLVTGKTGSGKSLLLHAILGEADVVSGRVAVPSISKSADPVPSGRVPATGDWLIPNAVAYVAQIPWIQNASLQDNITFDSPFDQARLDAVIEACALVPDLATLVDGRHTELGVNGINLSGGQKWRVTLARAIYSRADTLVLDDIFSAVDSHVGRHLYEKCLGGELCRNRTIILVTHHIGLCIGKASYLIELGNGGVICAKRVEAAMADKLLLHESDHHGDSQSNNTSTKQDRQCDKYTFSPKPAPASLQNLAPAQRFVKDEARARGAVSSNVWLRYFNHAGGIWIIPVAMLIFVAVEATIMLS